MSRKFLFAAAVITGPLLASTAAHADLISIGLQEAGVNGGAITTEATGDGSAGFTGISYGTFTVSASGEGSPTFFPEPDLDADTVSVNSTGSGTNTLNVFVTEQGLSFTAVENFISSFTSNLLSSGSSATLTSLYQNGSGGPYTGTELASAMFTTIGTTVDVTPNPGVTDPYSLTAEFSITTTGAGQQANLTIDIVPAPAIGQGLPALLAIGGVLAGIKLWSRNRQRSSIGAAAA